MRSPLRVTEAVELPRTDPSLFAFAAVRSLATTSLLEGERTFFGEEGRSADGLGEGVDEEEREDRGTDVARLSALLRLTSTG